MKNSNRKVQGVNFIFSNLQDKFTVVLFRLVDIFRLFPLRVFRLLKHFGLGLRFEHHQRSSPEPDLKSGFLHRLTAWWVELLVYLLECLGLGETYETLMDFVKFNTRPLSPREIELAKTIYGNNIRYKRVRVDKYALIGPRQARFCYVSFYIINSWKGMSDSTLIHELMHVWQYEKGGAVYMPRAIRAQYSKMAYDYGGVEALKECLLKGQNFKAFNFEQQADIVEDYFRIKNGEAPCWGNARIKDLWVYGKVLEGVIFIPPSSSSSV